MSNYTLFTPGPIDLPKEVLKISALPLVHHREEEFQNLLHRVAEGVKKIVHNDAELFFFASSGTGAMESACCNTLTSRDRPIITVCGKFGERWVELCRSYRVKPIILKEAYGKSVRPERLEDALKKLHKPTVIFTTLTETSTGALNDIKSFGEISSRHDCWLVVDGVAGIGADLCLQKDWNIDVLVGASQKALMSPPGISFISLSHRALKKAAKSDLPKYYYDLSIYRRFMEKNQMPFTPPISVFYGLNKGLEIILSEGIENVIERHNKLAQYVRKYIKKMGLEIFPENPSNALTVIKLPPKIPGTELTYTLKTKYQILIANGQGELKGKVIRIGHMGNYTQGKLARLLDALKNILRKWSSI